MTRDSITPPLQTADLHWHEGLPSSTRFNDIYFSRDDGLAETNYVFIEGNRLPERWASLPDQPESVFTLAETGFGTGLNFLLAWHTWRQTAPARARLHMISVEKYPLRPEDLQQALNAHPGLSTLSRALLDQYPALVPGCHRLSFDQQRVCLTLYFGDVLDTLPQLECAVDAWFLDGFAPAKNPDMWQLSLFSQMARLGHTDTTFSTFTAAGEVRRGLQAHGFKVTKRHGFGRKRDMLCGALQTEHAPPTQHPVSAQPWLQVALRRRIDVSKALVIGAGLAGAAVADRLAHRGWQVDVLEQADAPALRISGNPIGITFTRFSHLESAQNRYYQMAYLQALRTLPQVLATSAAQPGEDFAFNGVASLAYSPAEQQAQDAMLAMKLWPESHVQPASAEQLSTLTGMEIPLPGLWQPGAGWVNPASLVRAWLNHPAVQCHLNTEVTDLKHDGTQWMVSTRSGTDFYAPLVVVSTGLSRPTLPLLNGLPLRGIRGQITYAHATEHSRSWRHAINFDGYLTPALDGAHCIGATFHPRDNDTHVKPEHHKDNIAALMRNLPAAASELGVNSPETAMDALPGRVGFRCQSPDYLPLVGPLADTHEFAQAYPHSGSGYQRQLYPPLSCLPGLFVSLAHGSRGLTSTGLAADILAAYIHGEPFPVDQAVRRAIHPVRFLWRNQRKGSVSTS